ncbi:fimbrial biogenesis chaperone [Rivibacter subsaxonicus]|uniref:Fimbrial chaperone protein n=1 Tax=Rivibacter subsaxonicus TaxID=457575 RepID=A0A4Q7VEJ3_9BURK|nr:fimbria/pilus periplasmic chaperone [Rivibacter subsaxonicus]RZT93602.1 fimbrial chaperone protein [Rivibacter subsaxonicus]
MFVRRAPGIWGFALAAGLAMWCGAASAGTFGLSPMRVELSAAAPTAVLTLSNSGDTPVTLQIQARAWQQVGGQDEQGATSDLILNPSLATIPPGGEQIVRVALRNPPDRERERAYRLLVREVPSTEVPEAQPASLGLRMALAMDIPMFVAPIAKEGRAQPLVSIEKAPAGASQLRIANEGPRHLRLTDLVVSQGGQVLAQQGVFVVLAGAERRLPLAAADPKAAAAPIAVKAQSNVGPIELNVQAASPR